MGKLIDLIGQRFGNAVVIERVGTKVRGIKAKIKTPLWKCLCDCGNVFYATSAELRTGDTKSCGCLSIKLLKERSTTHGDGHSGSAYYRLYRIWGHMIERCENHKCPSYNNYGGRGIYICDEWHNYLQFKEWSLNHGYQDTLTIDRIDNNDGYKPDNCRWTNYNVQANNRRSCRTITIDGETKTISEWCDIFGTNPFTAYSRIDKFNWDPIKAVSTPARSEHMVMAVYADETTAVFSSANEAGKVLGIKPSGIRSACAGNTKTYKKIRWKYLD